MVRSMPSRVRNGKPSIRAPYEKNTLTQATNANSTQNLESGFASADHDPFKITCAMSVAPAAAPASAAIEFVKTIAVHAAKNLSCGVAEKRPRKICRAAWRKNGRAANARALRALAPHETCGRQEAQALPRS